MNEDNEKYTTGKVIVGEKKKLSKLIVIINIILIVPVIGILSYNFFNKNLGEVNAAAKETIAEIETVENKEEQEQLVKDYDFVHQMSNNLIVASDGMVWGNKDVTLKNIDLGIEMLSNDQYIVDELAKWKEGDFDNAAEVHNYCWRILEGNIGKAKGVSKEGIDKALNAIGKK